MIVLGLTSCDTCRKARSALQAAGAKVDFRDVRDMPLSAEEISRLLRVFGNRLVNRASTTWRSLPEDARQESPMALLTAHPTLMKRPVIMIGDDLWLGWDAKVQDAVLK